MANNRFFVEYDLYVIFKHKGECCSHLVFPLNNLTIFYQHIEICFIVLKDFIESSGVEN